MIEKFSFNITILLTGLELGRPDDLIFFKGIMSILFILSFLYF